MNNLLKVIYYKKYSENGGNEEIEFKSHKEFGEWFVLNRKDISIVDIGEGTNDEN